VDDEIPLVLNTPLFCAAWAEWVSYRKARRSTLTPHTIRLQWRLLAGMGPERAVRCIEQSILAGWIGLFEVRDGARGGAGAGGGQSGRVRPPPGKYDNLPIIEIAPPLPKNPCPGLFDREGPGD
jgi:hypothetical protein